MSQGESSTSTPITPRRGFASVGRTALGVSVALGGAVLLLGAATEKLPSNPLAGSTLFVEKGCIRCHSIMGTGGGSGPDLGRVHLAQSPLTMAGTLWNHSPRMTRQLKEAGLARPEFTVEEMERLTSFLYLLSYFDVPANVDNGRRVFFAKRCAECHVINSKNDSAGRIDLGHLRSYASPMFTATAVWNHGPQMIARMKQKGVPVPAFEENELNDLIGYIEHEGTPSTKHPVMLPVGDPQQGRKVFETKGCTGCHAVFGEGDGSGGPDLAEATDLNAGLTELLASLWHHGPTMWAQIKQRTGSYPELTVEEMNDLIMYLYFLQYVDKPGDVAQGKKIFEQQGCVGCHTAGGGPGKGAADLAASTLGSDAAVVTAIWNHLPDMEASMESEGLPWPLFEGRDMAHLVAFLRSQAGAGKTAAPTEAKDQP